ncbi:alpha/beta fold hydrolase [Streptomyces sp. 21So2-11]|uniref:alpha/beta fold hydrolase n=1 Tax=Streptomyces sp. 21So2-11 TaxID=3144408 RepID=UPI00321ADD5E
MPDFEPDPLDGGPESSRETPVPAMVESPEEFVAKELAQARHEATGPEPEGVPGTRTAAGAALAGWLRDMTYLADTLADGEDSEPWADSSLEALPLPRSARKAAFRLLVKYTFKDVYAYFFGGAGQAIRDVVREALDGLDGGPVVVVGHSLGSIVAYEVLNEQQTEAELFVTVGSPLAITEVQDNLAKPLTVPPGVAAWRNASDLRDLVALDHTLRPEYAPPDRVTDLLVTNGSGNHHGISEYLGSPPVSDPIRRLFDRRTG